MKNLLRLLFLSAIMAFITPDIAIRNTISCAPAKIYFRATITSVKSGVWSNPETWGGTIPGAADKIFISPGHAVVLDDSTAISGMQVDGTLWFDMTKPVELRTSGNIIVTGNLQITPAGLIKQSIKFIGINENNFVGGGMDVLDSDVGLWVMGAGQATIEGGEKTGWAHAIDGISSGTSTFTVKEAKGWKVGDDLSFSPTAANDYTCEERSIKEISGNTITLTQPINRSHPKVNNMWTTEVMNLTRSVNIGGEASGRAHLFVHSSMPQTFKYFTIHDAGPRKNTHGDAAKEGVAGRYGLHFHHCESGSIGSLVKGVVTRDIGNHAMVPHASDGITFEDNVMYNVQDIAFWWDKGHDTRDSISNQTNTLKVIHNIAAKISYVPRAEILDSDGQSEGPTMGSAGFFVGAGDNNLYKFNVATCIESNDLHLDNTGGFNWEADNETTQAYFEDNIAHNTATGNRNWQNSNKEHVIIRLAVYNCRLGIYHGAYANNYKFTGGWVYNSPVEIRAGANTDSRLEFANTKFDGAGNVNYGIEFLGSALAGGARIRVRGCEFKNFRTGNITNTSGGGGNDNEPHPVDIIQSGSTGFTSPGGATMYVQPEQGSAFSINPNVSPIPRFAPGVWGNGQGLRLEFFNSLNFTNPVNDYIVDPTINHNEWGGYVWYSVKGPRFSSRWTGYVMAQYEEKYCFRWDGGGQGDLWINNKVVENGDNIELKAGQWYPIRFDYISNASRAQSVELRWCSPSTKWEIIPYCQLSTTPQAPLPIRDPPTPYIPSTPIEKYKVYPIPNYGLFWIETPKGELVYYYKIINSLGKEIEKGQLTGNSKKMMDITGKPAGVYTLMLYSAKKEFEPVKVVKY